MSRIDDTTACTFTAVCSESQIREAEAVRIADWLTRNRFALARIRHRRDGELIKAIADKVRSGEYVNVRVNPFEWR